jgi:hypothetical protein
MQMPDANRILRTAAAELVVLALGAISAWLVYYLYGLDLLARMLYLFPSPNGLGLLGFILIPLLVIVMLLWAAVCVVFVIGLLVLWLAMTVAFGFVAVELAINLFADPAHHPDPLRLLQARIKGIELATIGLVRRFLP